MDHSIEYILFQIEESTKMKFKLFCRYHEHQKYSKPPDVFSSSFGQGTSLNNHWSYLFTRANFTLAKFASESLRILMNKHLIQ